jgi:tetratricopeptide (TPR) repeat protein
VRIPVELGEDETRNEFYGKALYLAGLCNEKLGDVADAKKCYNRCVREKRPWLPELHYYDHLSYLRLGKKQQAKAVLRKMGKAIEQLSKSLDTRAVYLHYVRSRHLLALGRRHESQNELRSARRLGWRPSHELNFNYRFGYS